MEARASGDIFLFESFRLDRRGLSRRDERGVFVPVVIGSRALDVLGVLIEGGGDLVLKDQIMATAWPGTVVEDATKRGDLDGQVVVLDDRSRPDVGHDLVFRDEIAVARNEDAEHVEGS